MTAAALAIPGARAINGQRPGAVGMPGNLIGASERFRALLDEIAIVAPVDTAVLLQGETGTGKELVARAIHDRGPRHTGRFVAVNCAAIPGPLLETEFFGFERGAYTGAVAQTIGRFQTADGEIGRAHV